MAFLARLNHTQRAVRWSAWKWTSLILAALVVGTIGALATYALGWRHTAQDTEMAAARAKAISIVRTRARNACDVSLSQSDLDECVQGVRATDFTAKALMAPKQPDAVRLVREGEGVWLVREDEGVRLLRQDDGLWLVREHVPGDLAAYDSCWVVDPDKIEPEDLSPEGWTVSGIWHGGCSSAEAGPVSSLPTD